MKMRAKLGCMFLFFVLFGCSRKPLTVNLPIPPGLPAAPTGFEFPPQTNGHEDQATMDNDRAQFEQDADLPALGPFFNNRSCLDCHSNPATGGNSALFEHRISPDDPDDQIASASLIHDQAVAGSPQQSAPPDAINTLRMSLSLFGDGFVEQIPDSEFMTLSAANGGQIIRVPILESPGKKGIGRFGWKDQHASLLSFAGDADFNEKGVGNRLVPDPQNGIEDNDNPTPTRPEDIDNYAEFMRSLKAPARGPITPQVTTGEKLFTQIGCALCHVPTLYTAQYQFHPFGDFLLHDIGTGDSIAQASAPANKVRTAPLWGVRVKARFLHDGRVFNLPSAIRAHRNEAKGAAHAFRKLSPGDRQAVIAFLQSL